MISGVLVIAETYCNISIDMLQHIERYVTVCRCNNKCPFGGSVDTLNLMHYYQFGHRKDIYLWYSSQLDSELHIPIALFRIFVVNINMLHIDRCVVTYRYVTDMLHIDMLPM